MKSTASRSPFQASAIAVALASSLFALTACGGGGGDSSTPSGTAGSAAGGTTAVASNAHGSAGASNSATSSGTPQGQGTAGSGTQQVPDATASSALQGLGTADGSALQGQGAAGSGLDLGPGNGPSNSAAQAAAWSGKGIGTEFARRIHATCPTFGVMSGGWGSKTTVSSIISCVAGSYAGTDLWTGQRCEVNIAANGDVRASRGGRAFRSFSALELTGYSWKDGAFYIQLDAEGKKVSNLGNDGEEAVFVYFDPQGTLKIREEAREDWSNDPEAVRIIQKMGDYFVVGVLHEIGEEMSRDDMIWCAIPR